MANQTRESQASAIDWIQYGAVRIVELVLKFISIECVVRTGRLLGWFAYWMAGSYRRLAQNNLRIAFSNELTDSQIHNTARDHFVTLGGNLLAGFKLPLMPETEILKRVSSEGIEHVKAADSEGRNIVYAVCHLSCWELLTQVPKLYVFGRTPGSIFQPLANPFLNALLLRRRQKLGYHLFDRSEGFSGPMSFIREGGCLGVLVDQHAGDHGVWSPFFGRLASTTPLAALMARRTNAVLLPIVIQSHGLGRWRLRVLPAVSGVSNEKSRTVEQVTADLNLVIEHVVREKPADWFWVHNRWKTPNPNFLLTQYRRGIALPSGMSADKLKPFEALVRSPNWLGDACMALPAVKALKRGRPDLRLTIYGPDKLRDLWMSQPEVAAYIGKVGKEGLLSTSKRLRLVKIRYDVGILFTNSIRSTLEFWLAGIPRLLAQKGSFRSLLLNQICPESLSGNRPIHHTEKYLKIVSHAGATLLNETTSESTGKGVSATKRRLGLCAGAEYGRAKRWPLDRFAEAANKITEKIGQSHEWQLFGASGEAIMGEELSSMLKVPHQNRVGKTSLSELIAELRSCELLLTNDTGTMHLAASLGVPTVSIFGSTEPSLTGPIGNRNLVLRHHAPCSPCFKRECPLGHYDCMMNMSVDHVVVSVLNFLANELVGSGAAPK